MSKVTLCLVLVSSGAVAACSSSSSAPPAPRPHTPQVDADAQRQVRYLPDDVNLIASLSPQALRASPVLATIAGPAVIESGIAETLAVLDQRCHLDVLAGTRRILLGQAGIDGDLTLVIDADWATPAQGGCIIDVCRDLYGGDAANGDGDAPGEAGPGALSLQGRAVAVAWPTRGIGVVTLSSPTRPAETTVAPGRRERLMAAIGEVDTTRPLWLAAVELPRSRAVLDEPPVEAWFDMSLDRGLDVLIGLRFDREEAAREGREGIRRMLDAWRGSELQPVIAGVRVAGEGRDAVVSAALDARRATELLGAVLYSLMSRA